MHRLTLDAPTTALVVIDMQNDFCDPEGFYGRAGRDVASLAAVAAPIRAMADRLRAAGGTVAFTRLVRDEVKGAMEERHSLRPKSWTTTGERLILGTPGAEVIDALPVAADDVVIDKTGYSAFHDTPLEAELRARGIRTVMICGVTTYACVLSSAFAAFDRDFDVVLLTDMVASWNARLCEDSGTIVDLLLGHAVPGDAIDLRPAPSAAAS